MKENLTPKQKEVVKVMRETGGRVSEFWRDGGKHVIEVLVPSDGFYEIVLTIHNRTFSELVRKNVLRYMPTMTQYENGWQRGWYELNKEAV